MKKKAEDVHFVPKKKLKQNKPTATSKKTQHRAGCWMLGPLCLNRLILQMVTTGLDCSVLRLTYLRTSKDEPVKLCVVDWHPFSAVLKVMPGVCGLELMGKQKNLTSLHQNIYQAEQVNSLGGEAGLFCHCCCL